MAKEPKELEDRVRTLENTRAVASVVGLIALALLGYGVVSTHSLASTLGELKQLGIEHTRDIDRIGIQHGRDIDRIEKAIDRLDARRAEHPGFGQYMSTDYLALPCHVVKLSGDELLTRCYGEHEDKHKLAVDARVFINGKAAKLEDLKPEMPVRMLTDEGKVVVLEATVAKLPPPPPEKTKPPKPEK
jgi:hypothetical protein